MITQPVPDSPRRYFWTVGLTALAILTATVTINYVVDPYLIHQWDTKLVQRLSPAQQKIMPWAKTYAVYRYRPEVVYLGSSRTEIGLPTDVQLFADKRIFNLAVKGGSFGDAVNMLRHTSVFHRPEIVIWGLDYGNHSCTGGGRTLISLMANVPEHQTFGFHGYDRRIIESFIRFLRTEMPIAACNLRS